MHMLPSCTPTFTLIVAVHVVTSLWRGKILQAICLHWRLRKLLQHFQKTAPRRSAIDVQGPCYQIPCCHLRYAIKTVSTRLVMKCTCTTNMTNMT